MIGDRVGGNRCDFDPLPAEARTRHRHHYYGRTYYGIRYCRCSRGHHRALVVGGVAGAVAGQSIIGHGLLGAAAGGVGGAVAGRSDRPQHDRPSSLLLRPLDARTGVRCPFTRSKRRSFGRGSA